MYQNRLRPLYNVLNQESVPQTIRQHEDKLEGLGLNLVPHVSIDFHSDTVNLYFSLDGPLTDAQAKDYIQLSDSTAPSSEEIKTIQTFIPNSVFVFAVTITVTTWIIERIAICAVGLPENATPPVTERVRTFLDVAPYYDAEVFRVFGWSFGKGGRYGKMEKSYCGNLQEVIGRWKRS